MLELKNIYKYYNPGTVHKDETEFQKRGAAHPQGCLGGHVQPGPQGAGRLCGPCIQ